MVVHYLTKKYEYDEAVLRLGELGGSGAVKMVSNSFLNTGT